MNNPLFIRKPVNGCGNVVIFWPRFIWLSKRVGHEQGTHFLPFFVIIVIRYTKKIVRQFDGVCVTRLKELKPSKRLGGSQSLLNKQLYSMFSR